MDIEHSDLKVLLRAFRESQFSELVISGDGVTLTVRQGSHDRREPPVEHAIEPVTHWTTPMPSVHDRHHDLSGVPDEKRLVSGRVGHFFPARSDDGSVLFSAGDRIEEGQTYGMIESMNLKYEVRADRSGSFERYLVEEGDPVEFGQPLVQLR